MRLSQRIGRLEGVTPPRRGRNVVPTGSLTEFVRALLAGAFTARDLDPTCYEQTQLAARLDVYLITLSPAHQEWAERSGWATAECERWERENLLLTPAEFLMLKALAPPGGGTC